MSMAFHWATANAVASGEIGSSWDLYFDLQDSTEYKIVRSATPFILRHAKSEAGITQLRGRLYREHDNSPVDLLMDLLNPSNFPIDGSYRDCISRDCVSTWFQRSGFFFFQEEGYGILQ